MPLDAQSVDQVVKAGAHVDLRSLPLQARIIDDLLEEAMKTGATVTISAGHFQERELVTLAKKGGRNLTIVA